MVKQINLVVYLFDHYIIHCSIPMAPVQLMPLLCQAFFSNDFLVTFPSVKKLQSRYLRLTFKITAWST